MTALRPTHLAGVLAQPTLIPPLHEDDVELLLVVGGFDLKGNRLPDEVGKHGERLGLLVEEHVDDRLRGEDAELAGTELPRLAHQLAQYLVADRLRGLQLAPSRTGRARLAQHVGERLASALA